MLDWLFTSQDNSWSKSFYHICFYFLLFLGLMHQRRMNRQV